MAAVPKASLTRLGGGRIARPQIKKLTGTVKRFPFQTGIDNSSPIRHQKQAAFGVF